MKNFIWNTQKIVLLMVAMGLTACGSIDTGNVGVRTTFTGEIVKEEIEQGFYVAITSSVDEYSAKEITVALMDMQPKAADNLTLADLDMEVYYTIDPNKVADMKIKYANRDVCETFGLCYPAYALVRSYARNAVYETVAKYDSLSMHRNRNVIADDVYKKLQSALDKDDAGVFTVTKVVVRDIKTDPSIEESIKIAVAKNKELEAKRIELEIANKQVEINNALSRSLTPAVLKQRELDVQLAAIEKGAKVNLFLGGGVTPLVNIK